MASIILGLAALFSATAFNLAIILIIAESAWVLAAAGALVISRKPASGGAAACQPHHPGGLDLQRATQLPVQRTGSCPRDVVPVLALRNALVAGEQMAIATLDGQILALGSGPFSP